MGALSIDKFFYGFALLLTAINVIAAIQTLLTPKVASGIHLMPSVFAFIGWIVASGAHRNLMIAIVVIDLGTLYIKSSQSKNRPR